MFPSYRNQSIDLQSKSIDWFLYDREHRSLMGLKRSLMKMSWKDYWHLTNRLKCFQGSTFIETGLFHLHKTSQALTKIHYNKQKPKMIQCRDYKKFSAKCIFMIYCEAILCILLLPSRGNRLRTLGCELNLQTGCPTCHLTHWMNVAVSKCQMPRHFHYWSSWKDKKEI